MINRLLIRPASLILACVVILAGPVFAASKQPIERFTLDNGLDVLVLPNHRIPAVNHMLWFRVGSADDPDGKSGLAHFHEHIMFKGSPNYKAGEYTRILDQNGGDHNAFTGRDATSYYVTITKDKLPLVMQLEADRLRGLTVSDEDALTERDVIIEERNQRTGNSPDAMLHEQMMAALFRNHPYRLPVIGWEHEIQALSKQDALDFHATYYQPSNAVLIVSGDITAAELKPLAEKYYGSLPGRPVPKRIWKQEPPQVAPRTVSYYNQHVKQPKLTRIYAAQSFSDVGKHNAIASLIMSHMLGGGKNSYLYRELVVEKKLATHVSTSYSLFSLGPATFTIELLPEAGISLQQLEAELDRLLGRFAKEAINNTALSRSKNLMKADAIYAREGLTAISNIMGWVIMAGQSPELFNEWPGLIEQVSLDDVGQAIAQIFASKRSVTGYLLPEGEAIDE